MNEDPFTTALRALTTYFHKNEISYVCVGGISVILTGRARITMDLDIILDHSLLDPRDFAQFLQNKGFSAFPSDFENLKEKLHANVYLKDSMFRIDMKGIHDENDERALKMAIDAEYNGIPIKINHPLNTVAYKLFFGSEQDYEDALAVYVRNRELIDLDELKMICRKLGVENLLNDFLIEVDELIKEAQNDP